MKINLNSISLCRGQEYGEFPESLSIKGLKEFQTSSTLRGKTVRVFDRGNQQIIIRFKNKRRHGSVEAAAAFVLTHASDLARVSGALTLLQDDYSVFQLDQAVVKSVESTIHGSTTEHHYEIIGASLQELPVNSNN